MIRQRHQWITLIVCTLTWTVGVCGSFGDVIVKDVYEAAVKRPRVYFLVKRQKDQAPLADDFLGFRAQHALLDTGASSILIPRRTVSELGIPVDPRARFMGNGVGGEEAFEVSESLTLAVAGYHVKNPRDLTAYQDVCQARFKIKQRVGSMVSRVPAVVGMPAMEGRVVILDAGSTNEEGEFSARLCAPDDLTVPKSDVSIQLRFDHLFDIEDDRHIPPFPDVAPNPLIDEVVAQHQGKTSRATWLLDTGGMLSLVSTAQAKRLGLVDDRGQALVKPILFLPVGGVGHMTQIPIFQVDRVVVPTVTGGTLIYINVRLGVHDISCTDPKTKERHTLDGIFGSNLLCASTCLMTRDIRKTAFSEIVIDMPKQQLGLCLQ